MYLMPTTRATRARAEEKEFKSFGDLLSYLEGTSYKIRRIWTVSAYYDRPSIEQLIAHIKSRRSKKQKPELFIIIGSINSGEEELEKLQGMKFGNEFEKGSGIRVTNCGYLFHSKGYLVETTRSGMCAIGSMNLTQAGLKKNEELLTYSRYTHYSKVPPLVRSFKEYVEACPLDDWSKEIGAVSKGEKGIRWLKRSHPRDKSTQENEEFVQGNDSNGSLSSGIADKLVQQYFKKLGLRKNQLVDERKFTLAFYKLIFEECKFRSKPYVYRGVTLRPIKPRKNKQDFAYSKHFGYYAHFDVTFASLPNQIYHCKVGPYLSHRAGGLTSILNVRVKNKQKEPVNALQLDVSKDSEKSEDDKDQYWEVYHDGSMMGNEAIGRGVECEKTLSKVKEKHKHWIKKSRGKELVYLDKLYVAKEVTWENSKKFLTRLLHYAIIRAKIKS